MSDEDKCKQLIDGYRAEAIALFQINQAGRAAAERAVVILVTLVGVATAAGINAESVAVAIPLPTAALLLVSYMCQQYADVSVTGAARAELERRIAAELDGRYPLIYEYAVAPVRERNPLVLTSRLLQISVGMVVLALVGVGFFATIGHDRPWYVIAGFAIGTLLSGVSAWLSFLAMNTSGDYATEDIQDRLDGRDLKPRPRLPPWRAAFGQGLTSAAPKDDLTTP